MSHDPRIEAACEGFYNDISGMTDWGRLAANDPRLADKYRASMARALAAADNAGPSTVTTGRIALASTNTDEYVLGNDEMLLGVIVPFTRAIAFGSTVTLTQRGDDE